MIAGDSHCAGDLTELGNHGCMKFAATEMTARVVADCCLPIDSLMLLTITDLPKSMLYLDGLQGLFFLLCGIRQVHDALLDALDCPIEGEAVVIVQLVSCD